MTQSILLTIKKMLGISEEYHAFDIDIIIHINSAFLTLNQLGVGSVRPFQITDESAIWGDFADPTEVPGIQTYVYLKTRLLFDPPTNSFLVSAIEKQIAELEWRMNVQVDPKPEKEETEEPSEPTEPPIEPVEPPVEPDEPETPIEGEENETETISASAFSIPSQQISKPKPERAIDRLLKNRR